MKKRTFVAAFAAAAMAPQLALLAQDGRSTSRRVGWLEAGNPTSFPQRRSAFLDALARSGFSEKKNLVVDYRYAGGKLQRLPVLAAELVALKPECVVAIGIDAIGAVRKTTSTIPIVMGTMDADPVKEGLIASLPRPGGNITGMIGIAWELAGKRLELLREIDPRIKHVAVLLDPRSPASHAHLRDAADAARTLKMELHLFELREPADIERAFRAADAARADAFFVVAVGMVNSHRARIAALAQQAKVPAIYSNVEFVADGGMIGYAPNSIEQFRRVAAYVAEILKGAKPEDLPVMQPTQFELVINSKTAKATGVQIPKSLLLRADRVID